MRIGVVTTSYPRFLGDSSGGFVSELNEWIADRGHQVEVIAAAHGHCNDSWQNASVTRISAAPGLFYQGGAPDAIASSRKNLWHALRFSTQLLRTLRARQSTWDGMVAHWLSPSAIACVLAASAKPIWATAHGGDVHLLAKLGLTPLVARLLDRPNLHLNFVSKAIQEVFAAHAGTSARALLSRSRVCSMGIPSNLIVPSGQTRRLPARPRIVFLGRLIRLKGVDLLLEALQKLPAPYEAVFAGEGPERQALQAQAKRLAIDVRWLGEVTVEERNRLLASADIVVICSRKDQEREEGMPLVALEALAAGAQLLVTRSGGLKEIPDSICHKVDPDSPEALRSVLKTLLAGERSAHTPGHWLESRTWKHIAPALLPGM